LYSGETYKNNPGDWIDILEEHFKERRKAFLVFDIDHLLKYVSEYASDLLEIRSNQIGVMTFSDLFPRAGNVPNILVDSNYLFKKVQDITYTTPSGKPVDIRFNLDQKPGMNGYVIWVELRERELTGTYRKISSLKPYSDMKHVFDSFEMGFLILDKDGVVADLNDHIKHLLRLPGEWEGCNLFTFPPLHQNKLSDFIRKCITGRSKHNSKVFKIKYSSKADSVNIRMSGIQLYDLTGAILGALISCKTED
jgi:PAS domain-containing protein